MQHFPERSRDIFQLISNNFEILSNYIIYHGAKR